MRRILIPTVVLVAALSLAGCSAAGSSTSSPADSSVSSGAEPADAGSGGKAAIDGNSDVVARAVATTGTVTITSSDPVKAANAAADIVDAAGGRIDSREETAATKRLRSGATLKLRIPAAALTETLKALRGIGKVQSTNLSSDDVTQESQNLDARITALSTSVKRLLALEAKAKDTKVLIELESAISTRQGELDGLVSERKLMGDQVAMSTITLVLQPPVTAPVKVSHPASPGDAFVAGLTGFGAFFTGVFVVLSYLAPWLIFAALVTFAVLYILRRRRRRVVAP